MNTFNKKQCKVFVISTITDDFTGKTVDVDGVPMAHVSAWWFTNLDFAKSHQKYIFWKNYTSDEYPEYDNYDAIDCGHSDRVPCDYDGVIGVPISFLNGFYNPEQFELLGVTQRNDDPYKIKRYTTDEYSNANDLNARATILIDGTPKSVYARILIRRKVGA